MRKVKEWAYENLKGDSIIWLIILLLSIFSVLVVYSATGSLAYKYVGGNTEYYLLKHGGLVFLSLFAMWVVHKIDYRYYTKISKLLLWVSVFLLLITWFFGSSFSALRLSKTCLDCYLGEHAFKATTEYPRFPAGYYSHAYLDWTYLWFNRNDQHF